MAWCYPPNTKLHVKTVDFEHNFRAFIVTQPKYYGTLFSERGKILFRQEKKDYEGALNAYSMAIVYAYDLEFLCQMLTNRSLVYLKLEK